ncbi:TetR/AcrR family transcriptional regulator [Demetria terragena]|uniref:TetR/AcrR family transcriptional regulator n=1 Tax=Demetria terragena TaxID=63959 RepID=UPI00037EC3BB|nr:TetR/AcrR family transcriptional regulator [Demetria terragena]
MTRVRSAGAYSRAQRRHLETVEEVKEIARERLVEDGLSGLSLRAIARDMGVVPSALYRYFPSHGHLLDAIADDAAASMLDYVEQAIAARPEDDHVGRWLDGLRAYRRWALEHTPGYSLNFGDLSGERSGSGDPDAVVRRLIEIIGAVVANAGAAGALDDVRIGIVRQLVSHLDENYDESEQTPAHVMASALSAWSAVHGTVALEVSGRIPDLGIDPDDYFEAQLVGISRAIGFRLN